MPVLKKEGSGSGGVHGDHADADAVQSIHVGIGGENKKRYRRKGYWYTSRPGLGKEYGR